MTTFKTFVFAAMMTVFTATAFANNNNHRYNRPVPAPAPMAVAHHNHRHDCRCRVCEDMRYRMEMERLHRVTRGPVRGCRCYRCEDMRHHMKHHPAPHHNNMRPGMYR